MKFFKLLMIVLFTTVFSVQTSFSENLSIEVRQNIEMLNYITILSKNIKANHKDRRELLKIRNEIINNILPSKIDPRTQQTLNSFLESIKKYELLERKRNRLEYITDLKKASAIREAIPNPIYLLSLKDSDNPIMAVISGIGMVSASIMNYASAKQDIQIEYLEKCWELDDQDREIFWDIGTEAWNLMLEITQENKSNENFSDDFSLTENDVDTLIKISEDNNLERVIQKLTENSRKLKSAGYESYYFLLMNTYYELACRQKKSGEGNYKDNLKNCLKIFDQYRADLNKIKIFRYDYDLLRVYPKVMDALWETSPESEYCRKVPVLLKEFEKEIPDNVDWSLRYMAALEYLRLNSISPKTEYLFNAADLLKKNIIDLSYKQENLLEDYVKPLQEEFKGDDSEKKEKERFEAELKLEKEIRKTQLPPVLDSLNLCCDLYYKIAKKVNINLSDVRNSLKNCFPNLQLLEKYGIKYPSFKFSEAQKENIEDYKDDTDININNVKDYLDYRISTSEAGYKWFKSPAVLINTNTFLYVSCFNKEEEYAAEKKAQLKVKEVIRPEYEEKQDIFSYISDIDVKYYLEDYDESFSDYYRLNLIFEDDIGIKEEKTSDSFYILNLHRDSPMWWDYIGINTPVTFSFENYGISKIKNDTDNDQNIQNDDSYTDDGVIYNSDGSVYINY